MIKKFEAHSKYEENIEIIKEDFVEFLDEGARIVIKRGIQRN